MKKDYVSLKSSLLLDCKKMLIREEIDENSTVQIDAGPNGSGLVYKVEKNGGLVNAPTGQK